jgi:hypothetical protein
MPVLLARFGQGSEFGGVNPVVALGIELNRSPTHVEEGRRACTGFVGSVRSFAVPNRLAKLVEGLTQATARVLAGTARPQELSQGVSAVGAVGLDGQIGEEGLDLVGGEVGDRLSVHGCSTRP